MGNKIRKTIENAKRFAILYIILWLGIAIVLVMPIAASIKGATSEAGVFSFNEFVPMTITAVVNIGSSFGKVFKLECIGIFLKCMVWHTLIYAVFVIISAFKIAPKSEYKDIEHGSSGWSERGEQYKILSKKSGIILAEDNYLPLDKRGNVNVLIVGRIWCW